MDVLNAVILLASFIGLSTTDETCYKKEMDFTGDDPIKYKTTKFTCNGNDYCCTGYNYTAHYEITNGSIVGITFGCILGLCLLVTISRLCCGRRRVVTTRRTVVTRRANVAVIHLGSSRTSVTGTNNPSFTDNSTPASSEPPPSYSDVMAAGVIMKPPTEQTLPYTQNVGFEGLQNTEQQTVPSISRNIGYAGLQNEVQQPCNTTTPTAPPPYPQS